MNLSSTFDCVIMLTWSNWHTEPRSNRYHYATRFAREIPVFFVQPWSMPGATLCWEPSETSNIEIVHCSSQMRKKDALDFRRLLSDRGLRTPLIWIYNSLHYSLLLETMPQAFRVFHATEDFFTPTAAWEFDHSLTAASVRKQLESTDLLITVSQGVLESCRTNAGYTGEAAVVENGCDAEFLLAASDQYHQRSLPRYERTAIFQGGINKRLDYELLEQLVQLLPNWNFLFCGSDEYATEKWRRLLGYRNVQYLGTLGPLELADVMCSSTVGLIPFVQDEWIANSFPLKALEYVACGLPVVTIPITALRRFSSDVYVARNAREFAAAIDAVAGSRTEPAALQRRRTLAQLNSYDQRFANVSGAVLNARQVLARDSPERFCAPIIAPTALEYCRVEAAAALVGALNRMRRAPAGVRRRLKKALGINAR